MCENRLEFASRRPVVLVRHAAVACAQPLASQAGIDILKAGGNAADAAVAMAAAMNVTQPCSTGLGGDAFCLFYDAKSRTVRGLNGSGRAPAALTLETVKAAGFGPDCPLPVTHGHSVTVPGAAASWVDTLQHFGSGKLSMLEVLEPAISLAETGFPISQTTAQAWEDSQHLFLDSQNRHGSDMLIDGKAPRWGEVFRNQKLANVFRALATGGKAGFYEGPTAAAIVEAVKASGGVMSLDDLRNHVTTFDEQIAVDYKEVRLWEIPPNGQGIVALMALNILKDYPLQEMGHNSTEYLHTLVEAVRLSFADAMTYVADPAKVKVPIHKLLSKDYAKQRRQLINPDRALPDDMKGDPMNMGSDTIYLTVVDEEGNACSFIISNYMGFGSGIVPKDCGFTLQNRGNNFSLVAGHLNCIAPGKRPYHTIIPAMLTNSKTGELLCSYGVMGGFMQPQGHVQVLLNMLEFGMNPQEALDQPRFCVGSGHRGPVGTVNLEEGIPASVVEALRCKGHDVVGHVTGYDRLLFGRGHVITKGAWWLKDSNRGAANDSSVLWVGSDPRADGTPLGY